MRCRHRPELASKYWVPCYVKQEWQFSVPGRTDRLTFIPSSKLLVQDVRTKRTAWVRDHRWYPCRNNPLIVRKWRGTHSHSMGMSLPIGRSVDGVMPRELSWFGNQSSHSHICSNVTFGTRSRKAWLRAAAALGPPQVDLSRGSTAPVPCLFFPRLRSSSSSWRVTATGLPDCDDPCPTRAKRSSYRLS